MELQIEDQREQLISEQQNALFSLNLPKKYIMSLIKLEFKQYYLHLQLTLSLDRTEI